MHIDLLFQILAEVITVAIAFGIFFLTWNARAHIDNRGLVFLGLAFLPVGMLDLLHALAYPGNQLFTGYDPNLAAQFWLAARFVLAGALLAAPLGSRMGLRPGGVLAGFSLLTIGLVQAIHSTNLVPVAYREGGDATSFMVMSEVGFCLALAGSLALLYSRRADYSPRLIRFLFTGIIFATIAGLLFASSPGLFDAANLPGRLGMVFAFYLFYQAFFEAGIQKPVQVLSEELDRSREEVRREQDFVATILDTSYALLMVLDDQGRILRFNQALSQNSGLPAGRIEGLPIWENGLFSETKEQIEEIYARLPGDASPFRYDSHLRSLDNRNIHIAWSISAHFAADQTIEYSVWTGIDISDRVQAEDELRYLSTHDTLTGLYNRAFFEAEMIRLAETDRFPASIVIADVDGLKRINDNFGHMVGDKLIQRAAHILRSAFRAEDVVARMGGDEFAVLLPDADEAVLLHCQRRVAAIMAAHNQVSPDSPISISLGGATSPDGYVLMETYKKADQAMYHQKALSHARQKAE